MYLDGSRDTHIFGPEQVADVVFLVEYSYGQAKELALDTLFDYPGVIKDRETFDRLVIDLEADLRGLLQTGGELNLSDYLNDY